MRDNLLSQASRNMIDEGIMLRSSKKKEKRNLCLSLRHLRSHREFMMRSWGSHEKDKDCPSSSVSWSPQAFSVPCLVTFAHLP